MVYTICIGSNVNRKENLALARKRLSELFPNIRFSAEADTEPLFFRRQALFANQVARFTSDSDADEIILHLKDIEREAGRTPEEKKQEIVRLDIDFLSCDSRVYKPEDLKRDYIIRGLKELNDGKSEATNAIETFLISLSVILNGSQVQKAIIQLTSLIVETVVRLRVTMTLPVQAIWYVRIWIRVTVIKTWFVCCSA